MNLLFILLDFFLIAYSILRIVFGMGNYSDYLYLFFAILIAIIEVYRRKETRS